MSLKENVILSPLAAEVAVAAENPYGAVAVEAPEVILLTGLHQALHPQAAPFQ